MESEIKLFLYATLGVCGLLIGIRILIFLVSLARKEDRRRGKVVLGRSIRGRDKSTTAAPRVPDLRAGMTAGHDNREIKPPKQNLIGRFVPPTVFSGHGLTGRMIAAFAAIVAIFGLLAISTVYVAFTSALRSHAAQRARITALALSDQVPAYVFKNNVSGLREFLRQHASRPGIAYALVENRAGEIVAHSFTVLSPGVKSQPAPVDGSQKWRVLNIEQGAVYEVTAQILEGQLGVLRLGIWADGVDAEILRIILPVVKLIASTIGLGILLTIFLAWKINRPILRLVRAARLISSGDLDTPAPGVEDPTEFGELSRAFERMRSSIKAAMTRLG